MFKNFNKMPWVLVLLVLFLFPLGFGGTHLQADKAFALSGGNNPMGNNLIVEIARAKNSAVVSVSSKMRANKNVRNFSDRGQQQDPFSEFYERFFGQPPRRGGPGVPGPERSPRGGTGSGFFIDKDGYILTNHHVIENAEEITVFFEDEKEYEAELIGSDSKTDIALIKINREEGDKPFPYLEMGDSDKLEVGEWVVAIGNPFGLSHTVTTGIVSAMGRNIGAGPYDEFIQTDASINPGNSGGPLINMKGEVIGINTAIISGNSGGNVGIGFATPINMARNILKDLKEKGSVTRGWLGVFIQKVTPELATSLGLEGTNGALVANVSPEGPALEGGIQRGDVIVKFGDKEIDKMDELPKIVASTRPGDVVNVEVIREGKKQNKSIKIAMLPSGDIKPRLSNLLGTQVQEITPELAQSMKLDSTEGVLVSEVTRGEAADKAGVRRGDIILEVDHKAIKDVSDFRDATSRVKKDSTVLLLVKRDGTTIFVGVKVE